MCGPEPKMIQYPNAGAELGTRQLELGEIDQKLQTEDPDAVSPSAATRFHSASQ